MNNIIWVSSTIRILDSQNAILEFNGKRHHEIIKQIHDAGYIEDYKRNHIDGFTVLIDNKPLFLSREEATKIAKEENISMIGSYKRRYF